jgi:ribosomal protein S18 acetylase RimI-like enzyme
VKARGFDGIRMLVSVHNLHALALYDKNGFQRLDIVHMYGLEFYRYQLVL